LSSRLLLVTLALFVGAVAVWLISLEVRIRPSVGKVSDGLYAGGTISIEGIRPQVSRTDLAKPEGNKIYKFTISLDVPEQKKSEIAEVSYSFNPPSGWTKPTQVSSDPASGFAISYDGWGCSYQIVISIVLRNGRNLRMSFDQCEALRRLEGLSQ
jgi:hypothetical protein